MSNTLQTVYTIIFSAPAKKQLRKLHLKDQDRVIARLEQLRVNPYAKTNTIRHFWGVTNGYRLRIGDIRVVYAIEKDSKLIQIVKIGYRGDVYKN